MNIGMYDTWPKVMQPVLCTIMHYHTWPVGGISLNVSRGNLFFLPGEMHEFNSELK